MSQFTMQKQAHVRLIKLANAAAVIRRTRRQVKWASGTAPDTEAAAPSGKATAVPTPAEPLSEPVVPNSNTGEDTSWLDWAKTPAGIGTLAGVGIGGALGASQFGLVGGLAGAAAGGFVGNYAAPWFASKEEDGPGGLYMPETDFTNSYIPFSPIVAQYDWSRKWDAARGADAGQLPDSIPLKEDASGAVANVEEGAVLMQPPNSNELQQVLLGDVLTLESAGWQRIQ